MNVHKQAGKYGVLFLFGGLNYGLIELLYRSYTHWTMLLVGGSCFILIGLINEILSWEVSLVTQGIIGSILVTIVEFIAGCIINLYLGWNVWDYSNVKFNILGQVCLPFMGIWFLMSLVCIMVDDYLRYKVYHEDYPRYKVFPW